ncbi:MotA/TolQ/ExbB proton channel family protein, partial [Selenomonadales bacterium OttesenSCG-928-I06]|nr:MotA/TolQ/ExbB proton channel family protein [Selenomonadales bacterium OttesenSCG-928-I06]
ERLYHYSKASGKEKVFLEIKEKINANNFEGALQVAEQTSGPIAAIAAEALIHRQDSPEVLQDAISIKGSLELARLNQNLHILELIGRIAPMIGLLGTVMGMVTAFQKVATVKGSVDPSILAGGIWEALLTTVAGLCVALPALVIHHFFEDKVNSLAFQMKHCANELLRLLGGEKLDRV